MRRYLILLAILIIPSLAMAGSITLTTTITADILTDDDGEVQISITNFGNEAAHNVQMFLVADHFSFDPVQVGTLYVNQPFETIVPISTIGELKEGNYNVALLVEYTDLNGYPFSSVFPFTITNKRSYLSKVTGVFENIELSGSRGRDITLKLKNMDQAFHEAKVKLVIPNELSSDPIEKTVNLDARSEEEVKFRISNFAALPNSAYSVLAIIDYEGDYHYSSSALGMVTIVEGKEFSNIPSWIVFPIIGVLVVIFLIYQVKSRFVFKIESQNNGEAKSKSGKK